MPDYKIYILDHSHIVRAYDFEGPDDQSALEESKKHSGKSAVEIWHRAQLIARIDQGGQASNR